MRVNILHVFVTLPVGGAEQLLLSIVNNLDNSRYNSIICCIRDKGEIGKVIEQNGFKVIELNSLVKPGWDGEIVNKLVQIISEYRIDIIHSHLYHANLYSRFAARQKKITAIISIHNTYNKPKIHHRIINWFLLRYTSAIIVGSEDIKQDVIKYDRAPSNIIYKLNNAVNISSIKSTHDKDSSRKMLNISSDDFLIGTIGRLEEQKGHSFLIDAIYKLQKKDFYPKLIIIGDGSLRDKLEQQVEDLSIQSQVKFLGTRKDIGDIFPAIDIFVMPSLWEGLSIAMLSAMAAGIPVIATRVGGVDDVLQNSKYGVIIKPNDSDEIAEAILSLSSDGGAMNQYTKLGSELVRSKYSDVSMVRNLSDIYKKHCHMKNM